MYLIKSIQKGNLSFSGSIHHLLIASSLFSCLLLLIRVCYTHSLTYCFLPWNLFLAFIPYWITWWIIKNPSVISNKWKRRAALAAWLLFVPNSFYIITDLFHLIDINTAPKWFDLLMIFSFAWNGIICGIISLRRVELILELLHGTRYSFILVTGVMWLNALGIYIGRYLRFNSWDIISNPFSLSGEIVDMIIHPFDNFYAWGMTWGYATFITFLYLMIKKLSEFFGGTIRN